MVDTPEDETSSEEESEDQSELFEEEEEEFDENLQAIKQIEEEEIDEETLVKEQAIEDIRNLIYCISFLDILAEHPRYYSLKQLEQVKEKFFEPYGEKNEEFGRIWNGIEPDIITIINKGDDLAEAKGGIFKMSYRKASLVMMVPIIGAIIGMMIGFTFLGTIIPQLGMFTYFIMILPICILCFGQPYLDRYLKNLWERKRSEIKPKFKEICFSEIEKLRTTTQRLIKLANSAVLEYDIRPERIQFTLFYSDYDGINILGEEPKKYYTVYYAQLSQ